MFINFQKLKSFPSNAFSAERNILYDPSSTNETFEVIISVSSEINEPLLVELRDEIPEGIILASGSHFKQDKLEPNYQIKVNYKVKLAEKSKVGIFRFVNLILYDPLMIVGRKITLEAHGEIYSSELLSEAIRTSIILKNHQSKPPIGISTNPFIGHDEEFISVRTYEEGDSIRYIHWKKSASLQSEELLIKKFEKLAKTKISIIVDCSQSINAGMSYQYIEAVKFTVSTIMRAALESGNTVKIYLLNPIISRQQYKKTEVRNLQEAVQKIAMIFSTNLKEDSSTYELISKELQKDSYLIIFTNPPTINNQIISHIIETATNKNCKTIIFMPSIDDYYLYKINNLDLTNILEIDKILKLNWLLKFGEEITTYYVSPTSYVFDAKRIFMGRRTS